jgi:hypothetical protein
MIQTCFERGTVPANANSDITNTYTHMRAENLATFIQRLQVLFFFQRQEKGS